MLNLMYPVLFVLSFLMLAILVAVYKNRISIYYVLLFACVAVSNIGYMTLNSAEDLAAAKYANQIVYLGAGFSSFFMTMCIADICKAKLSKPIAAVLLALGALSFIFVSINDVLPLYYRALDFTAENGLGYLVKDYGPLHTIFPVYLLAAIAADFVLIINALRRKRDVSYISATALLCMMVVLVGIYGAEKLLHLKAELLPIAYVVFQGLVLVLLRRVSFYNVTAVTANSMVASREYGFAIFDSNGRFLGCDDAAKEWFPELKELVIDLCAPGDRSALLGQIMQWIGSGGLEPAYYECGGQIIEARPTVIKAYRGKTVYCIYFRDDTKQQEYTRLVERYNVDLERTVEEKTKKIQSIQDDIIISMASIVENRDSNTGGHIARTSDIMKIFVRHLLECGKFENLTPETAKCITKAAPLHDFGKIAIPDVILNKPGKYTPEEYAEMKKHSAKGAVIVDRILQSADDTLFKTIAVNVAHYHHEKWDGTGYPVGISGESIPFEARVMALADVFDALVSKRVYKDRYSYDKAFSIIEESCGSHFDPELCPEFLACRPELEALYNSYTD